MKKACKVALFALGLALGGGALAEGKAAPPPAANAAAQQETVNINTADAETLARVLQGIGAAKAEAIVAYRKEHGDFVDVYELANVKGVGRIEVRGGSGKDTRPSAEERTHC